VFLRRAWEIALPLKADPKTKLRERGMLMVKKRNVPDRGGAAALRPVFELTGGHSGRRCERFNRRAAALFVLLVIALGFPTRPALGQGTQILGGQLRVITNQQSGTSYTLALSDCGKLLLLSNAGGVTITRISHR
jgi:hypothetical protein